MADKTTNKSHSMSELQESAYLDGTNSSYLEQLYQQYLADPNSLSETNRAYFSQLSNNSTGIAAEEHDHEKIKAQFRYKTQHRAYANSSSSSTTTHTPAQLRQAERQAQVYNLINAYRIYGHHHAQLDPLTQAELVKHEGLNLANFNLAGAEDEEFSPGDFSGLVGRTKLSHIISALERTYCHHIGFEYKHITNFAEVEWLRTHIESNLATPQLSAKEKKFLLKDLIAAANLEKHLGRKYVGQKRFSLEGGDALIPLLNDIVYAAPNYNIKEVMLGMAHRGRLNVLVNVLGKKPLDLFNEFEGKIIDTEHSGDVKYHLGFSSDITIDDKSVHLSLAFNPSHLEIVTPVVAGQARAKQRRRKDKTHEQVLPITLHGDAAFAAQGVVMETLAMSQVRGFTVGGSIRVIINNQVGFTTHRPEDARSSLHCSDVAKMIQAPIFHVNGDDPEAVLFVTRLAMEYRQTFHKDVVIDLVCYRRHGHNESDEPSSTQPLMYQKIKQKKPLYQSYGDILVAEGSLAAEDPAQLVTAYQTALDQGQPVTQATDDISDYEYSVNWQPYLGRTWRSPAETKISEQQFKAYGQAIAYMPDTITLQAQVKKLMQTRQKMAEGELPADWGFAENLAYASLLDAGYPIRLCGEDTGRGTFAHRHAVLHDQTSGASYIPLRHVSEQQASIIIIDSLLSEEGVLAFEYGFASAEPNNLAVWEAQFGDFANCAQVVIDQFISSGEQKWGRLCGLVMLLPHGYEGMGPEHSSARMERYLQLCAQDNMQVCVPSTPAQIFHLLRRQMIRACRIPLIVITPKSLLRHKLVVSELAEFTDGQFELIIPEVDQLLPAKKITRLVLCSGKVYYDLLAKRREQEIKTVAIVRMEQLYPFPESEIIDLLKQYATTMEIVWCQEEPKNQGAWYTVRPIIEACLQPKQQLSYVGRPPAAAPAVGVNALHVKEQAVLVQQALDITDNQ